MAKLDLDDLWEALGTLAVVVSLFLTLFGSWVWAQGNVAILDAQQSQDIAVLKSQVGEVSRRVTDIENRLFAILTLTIGTTLGAATSALFTIRTYRRVKNGGKTG